MAILIGQQCHFSIITHDLNKCTSSIGLILKELHLYSCHANSHYYSGQLFGVQSLSQELSE